MSYDCYWSKSSKCDIKLYQNENDVFIITSAANDRKNYVKTIMQVVEELNLTPIFATELRENNNQLAFCNNICAHIRGSRLIIVDLSASLKKKM